MAFYMHPTPWPVIEAHEDRNFRFMNTVQGPILSRVEEMDRYRENKFIRENQLEPNLDLFPELPTPIEDEDDQRYLKIILILVGIFIAGAFLLR